MKDFSSIGNLPLLALERRLSLKLLVLVLVAVPSLVTLGLLVPGLQKSFYAYTEVAAQHPRVELVFELSALVHELQKERGLSAGFEGSKGRQFQGPLELQRQYTDAQMKRVLDRFRTGVVATTQSASKSLQEELVRALEHITVWRQRISMLASQDLESFRDYTTLIAKLHSFSTIIVHGSRKGGGHPGLQAHVHLSEVKEALGAQRGILNKILTQADRRMEDLFALVEFANAETIHRRILRNIARSSLLKKMDALFAGDDYRTLASARAYAVQAPESRAFPLLPEVLWKKATRAVDRSRDLMQDLAREVRQGETQIREGALGALYVMVGGLALFLTLMVVFSRVVIRRMLRGIAEGVQCAEEIARGNLETRVDAESVIMEFTFLLRSLESMRKRLQELSLQEKEYVVRLQENQAARLDEGVQVLTPAIEEIVGNASRVSARANDAATALSVTTNSVENLASAARSVYENAEQLQSLRVRASESAEKGKLAANQNIARAAVISDQMKEIASEVDTLRERLAAVSVMLALLQSMTEQSRMLSINAEITAAYLGVKDSGFSVIAGEMRKLAEISGDSAKKMQVDVEAIEHSMTSTVDAITQGIEVVEAGVLESQESQIAIEGLSDVVVKFSRNFQEVAGFLKKHEQSLDKVKTSLDEMKAASHAHLSSTRNLGEVAVQLDSLVVQLRGGAGKSP